jgi:hypothetical protein
MCFKILQLDLGSAHSDSANILLVPGTIPLQLHTEYTLVKIWVLLQVLESNESHRGSTRLDSNTVDKDLFSLLRHDNVLTFGVSHHC